MDEEKSISPEQWDEEVKAKLDEFISNFLSVAKDCNMGTKYEYPIKDVFDTHIEYDQTKVKAAELRIVFNFVGDLPIKDITFI